MLFERLPKRAALAVAGAISTFMASVAQADYALNMTEGVTPISREVYSLHMGVFWLCVVIGIGVFGVMAYSIFHHRKSKGAEAANFHESTTVEVIWTVIPLIILIVIAVPATSTLLDLENAEEDAEINIQVTGLQWKWRYKYLDDNVEFVANLAQSSRDAMKDPTGLDNYLLEVDNHVVVPVNKKIRFLFHSDDVIHSWWVPDLAVKQDTIPGFINDSWATIEEPGIYRGQCAELCGKDHGFMPIVVEAVTEPEYRRWVAEKQAEAAAIAAAASQEWSKEDLIAKGEQVYQTNCVACHGATGAGIPGVFPAVAGSSIVNGEQAGHIDILLNGVAGSSMAAFRNQLSDVDIAAVITFKRNAFGNTANDVVQPSTVKESR